LSTALFDKTESRGSDAAGIWGTTTDGKIIYQKEPIKSSEFVKKDFWKSIKKRNVDLLLMHARAASLGFGPPHINKNNHPFVSSDKTTALIHNGRIPDTEYRAFKKKYEVSTDCDSELYLRVYEACEDKLKSLQNLWAQLNRSQMAVAIGELLPDNKRRLWLFRNKYRSIWLADLRDSLGQIFFFSTQDIWEEAVYSQNSIHSFFKRVKLIELPTEEVWSMTISSEKPCVEEENLQIFEVKFAGNNKPWTFDGDFIKISQNKPINKIITRLDDDEDVEESVKSPAKVVWGGNSLADGRIHRHPDNNTSDYRPFSSPSVWGKDDLLEQNIDKSVFPDMTDPKKCVAKLSALISDMKRVLDDIEIGAENLLLEDSMANSDYQELMTSLESAALDLEGTLKIVENKSGAGGY
jgi:hypothetical protein